MLARHKLVWLSKVGWESAGHGRPEAEQAAMRRWRDNAWPAVARRAEGSDADTGEAENTAWLALALPPDPVSGIKRRVGFCVARHHVLRVEAPLTLKHALGSALVSWQSSLRTLDAEATGIGLCFHVFGSLAWQAMTGLQYLSPRSDIDLLCYPRSRHELDAGLRLLARHATSLPLDGEIVFPGGSGVAWKEWLQGDRESAPTVASGSASTHESRAALRAPRVLVKSPQSVGLVARADLIATLGEVACPG
jgi:phosphoribosyl-dephospho-CoA transferase